MRFQICVPLALSLALMGCGNAGEPISFPEGLEPLAENQASWPDGEGLNVTTGDTDDYSWAHARGKVDASLEDVYAAVTDQEVSVDRREVTEYSVDEVDPGEYDISYVIHNLVEDVINVEYDVTWRHGPTAADGDDVITTYGSRWQMTTTPDLDVIKILRGSIEVSELDDGLIGLEYVEELGSLQRNNDPDTAKAFLEDHFGDVQAMVNGESLPTYPDE